KRVVLYAAKKVSEPRLRLRPFSFRLASELGVQDRPGLAGAAQDEVLLARQRKKAQRPAILFDQAAHPLHLPRLQRVDGERAGAAEGRPAEAPEQPHHRIGSPATGIHRDRVTAATAQVTGQKSVPKDS